MCNQPGPRSRQRETRSRPNLRQWELIVKVTQPNSKPVVWLPPVQMLEHGARMPRQTTGTLPDHVVETKTADLVGGVDPQLDLALKLAETKALPK